jgi:hypothetical protein
VAVQSAAIDTGEQWSVGAFTDRRVDGASSPWREREEGGLVALADDTHHVVAVGDREIGQVRGAVFGNPQRVEPGLNRM